MIRFFQIFTVLTVVFFFESSFAHKISVFAWVEGNTVNVESKFSGGRKVMKGKVIVKNRNGEIVNQGTTNTKGEYSFKLDKKEIVKIFVNAGVGHKGSWELTKEDLGIDDDNVADVKAPDKKESVEISNGYDIRGIVDQVVKQRLKPIHRELALLREAKEPGFQDIIGGVGYIFGLMGIFMYFRYGRKK